MAEEFYRRATGAPPCRRRLSLALLVLVACIAAAPMLWAVDWRATVFELDMYQDRIAGAHAVEHNSGYYPTTGGPSSGQFWVSGGSNNGLPLYSHVQDFVKIRELGSVTYTFYPGTVLPIRTNAIYLLLAGDQIHSSWSGFDIAELRIDFTDGSALTSAQLATLKLVAGTNLRNSLSTVGGEGCLTSFSSAAMQNIWSGTSANPSWGTAYVDLLKIALPEDLGGQDYTLKKLSSITITSLQGARTVSSVQWRPGLNLYGLTAPGFRANPHGYYFTNTGQECDQLARAYAPAQPRGAVETNTYQLLADTFTGISTTVSLNKNDWVDANSSDNRLWGNLMGTLKNSGFVRQSALSKGGVCFGLAATSVNWYTRTTALSQSTYGRLPNRTGDLGVETLLPGEANEDLALYKWNMQLHYRQFTQAVQDERKLQLAKTPNDQQTMMLDWLLTNRPFVICVYGPWGGHAVAPRCMIKDPTADRYLLYVYDVNYPDRTSPTDWSSFANTTVFDFDRGSNTFWFNLGGSIGSQGSPTLSRVIGYPLDLIENNSTVDPGMYAWSTNKFVIFTHTPYGDLGLTNPSGQRFGMVGGAWREEIADAQGIHANVVAGEPATTRAYALPTDTYTISYSATGTGPYHFSVVLPKGEVIFDSACVTGTADTVVLGADGRSVNVSTTSASATSFDVELAAWAPTGLDAAYVFSVTACAVASDGATSVAIDDGTRSCTITNAGSTSRSATVSYSPGEGDDRGVLTALGTVTVDAGSTISLTSTTSTATPTSSRSVGGGGGCAVNSSAPQRGNRGLFLLAALLMTTALVTRRRLPLLSHRHSRAGNG